jgi:hypothetical protein
VSCMPHTMHLLSFLFLGLLGFLQLVPTATFELSVGPNWQPDSSGGQRTLHFPFHRVYKLVGLSRRVRRHLGRTPLRETQGDSASRSPALPISLSLLRGAGAGAGGRRRRAKGACACLCVCVVCVCVCKLLSPGR